MTAPISTQSYERIRQRQVDRSLPSSVAPLDDHQVAIRVERLGVTYGSQVALRDVIAADCAAGNYVHHWTRRQWQVDVPALSQSWTTTNRLVPRSRALSGSTVKT